VCVNSDRRVRKVPRARCEIAYNIVSLPRNKIINGVKKMESKDRSRVNVDYIYLEGEGYFKLSSIDFIGDIRLNNKSIYHNIDLSHFVIIINSYRYEIEQDSKDCKQLHKKLLDFILSNRSI
jgi:hypothetical protein